MNPFDPSISQASVSSFGLAVAALSASLLAGCGARDQGTAATSSAADAAAPVPEAGSVDSATSDGAPPDARAAAVNATIASNPLCTALPAFYWEIGDARGPLASGAVGALFSASTSMNIASASKLVFGAYVVERFKTNVGAIDGDAMRMLSGYTSLVYDTCVGTASVSACFAAASNATHTAANDGHFFYNGGHFQKYAIDLGLGDDDSAKLTTDVKSLLGSELAFVYASPQLAGGIKTSAADYASFLRKILAGKLALHDHLGENAVCTLPSACPSAVSSPAPAAWHYSYGHWVEDDPAAGDGAFSSPGAFGFYPWIDSSKTYYGVLARYSLGAKAYVESAACGHAIRRAFLTGTPQ